MFTRMHVFRVKPKQELSGEIMRYCTREGVTSGVVVGIIGSVEDARLNYLKQLPGMYETVEYHGPLEPHQQKRADKRTYDHLVYYGDS